MPAAHEGVIFTMSVDCSQKYQIIFQFLTEPITNFLLGYSCSVCHKLSIDMLQCIFSCIFIDLICFPEKVAKRIARKLVTASASSGSIAVLFGA